MKRRILVIAAHPDDEILGIGGTVARLIDEGDEAYCLVLGEGMTSRSTSRTEVSTVDINMLHDDTRNAAKILGYYDTLFENFPDNRFDSVDLLDIVKRIENHIKRIKPNMVFTHFYGDLNVDHQVCHAAVLTATRPVNKTVPSTIYAFETLSSTEWNFVQCFRPNFFVDISSQLERKIQAMACYISEIRHAPHPRSLENIRVTAKKWGSVVGVPYAEAFEIVRQII